MDSTCIFIHFSLRREMREKEVIETIMVQEWTVFYMRYENLSFHSYPISNKYSIYPAQVYGVPTHVVNATPSFSSRSELHLLFC